jgi:hypothetical protein
MTRRNAIKAFAEKMGFFSSPAAPIFGPILSVLFVSWDLGGLCSCLGRARAGGEKTPRPAFLSLPRQSPTFLCGSGLRGRPSFDATFPREPEKEPRTPLCGNSTGAEQKKKEKRKELTRVNKTRRSLF